MIEQSVDLVEKRINKIVDYIRTTVEKGLDHKRERVDRIEDKFGNVIGTVKVDLERLRRIDAFARDWTQQS